MTFLHLDVDSCCFENWPLSEAMDKLPELSTENSHHRSLCLLVVGSGVRSLKLLMGSVLCPWYIPWNKGIAHGIIDSHSGLHGHSTLHLFGSTLLELGWPINSVCTALQIFLHLIGLSKTYLLFSPGLLLTLKGISKNT